MVRNLGCLYHRLDLTSGLLLMLYIKQELNQKRVEMLLVDGYPGDPGVAAGDDVAAEARRCESAPLVPQVRPRPRPEGGRRPQARVPGDDREGARLRDGVRHQVRRRHDLEERAGGGRAAALGVAPRNKKLACHTYITLSRGRSVVAVVEVVVVVIAEAEVHSVSAAQLRQLSSLGRQLRLESQLRLVGPHLRTGVQDERRAAAAPAEARLGPRDLGAKLLHGGNVVRRARAVERQHEERQLVLGPIYDHNRTLVTRQARPIHQHGEHYHFLAAPTIRDGDLRVPRAGEILSGTVRLARAALRVQTLLTNRVHVLFGRTVKY